MFYNIIAIIFLIILCIYIVKQIEYNEYIKSNNNTLIKGYTLNKTCSYLHIDNDTKKYKIKTVKLLEPYECKHYINSLVKDVEKRGGFDLNRHDNYPTTDKEVTGDWEAFPMIKKLWHEKIKLEFSKLFNIRDTSLINVTEIFFVKYTYAENMQKSLDPHKDGSEMSFIIALNDEYTGGGTNFIKTDITIKLNIGECLLFSGKERHQGLPITSGNRFILTGFIHYNFLDFCEAVLEQQSNIDKHITSGNGVV
jgi:hypothetical protein